MIKRFIIIILNSSRISKSLILFAVSFFFALISFSNNAFSLPFCNSIISPTVPNPAISGGNCVLPSCNVLPQSLTGSRNPGVNCLADCNAMPSGTSPIQGQNCLFDCNNLPAGTDPKIGGNCAFSINGSIMPFCNPVPTPIGYVLNPLSRYILEAGITKDPRVNCADLIDLPLCSMANPNNRQGKNCVEKCNNITGSSEDLSRKHNRDCLRICSEPEAGASASALTECSQKKCHHLIGTAIIPDPGSNCEIQKCSNLTGYELNKASLYARSNATHKYCDASIKCLNFNKSQLDTILATYTAISDLKTSPLFRICQQHDCRTEFNNSCAPYASDDTAKIQDTTSYNTANYNTAYINTIIKTASPTSSALNNLCKIKICRGQLNTQLPCSGSSLTIPNPSCTSPATCDSSGYCIKRVDCDSPSLPDIDRSIYCDGTPVAQAPVSKDHSNAYPYLIEKTWFYLPKPLDKSYQNDNPSSQPFRVMDVDNMCYRVQDMTHATNDFGKTEGWLAYLFGGNPYFHDYLSYPTRSPNICSPTFRNGSRGLGYTYLCGVTDYSHPPNMQAVGYIDSITSTWGKESVIHKLRVCLRYNNAMIPQGTCGARECGITCAFANCSSVCGYDECRELTISDSSVRGCEDPTNASGDCVAQIGGGADIDSYIRVRAVGFPDDSRVCAILDWKGGLAYDNFFMTGEEYLSEDRTKCLSGSYDVNTNRCTGGKNSNDDNGRADIWRALGLIKYIDGNFTSANNIRGIKDLAGNFYPESSCIRRQVRAAPPNFYNLANYDNSPGLFSPPLIIKSVKRKKGGEISPSENPAKYTFGVTDFNQPEVEILFGNTTALLSLDTGKNGNESSPNADINGSAHLTTTVAGKTFPADVYAKKSSDPFGNPQFCVYRKLLDKSNVEITPPPSIGCVRREAPEIDKCDSRDGLCVSLIANINQNYREKILLSKVVDNTLENYKKIILKFRFLVNYNNSDISNLTCPASNTGSNITCSPELSIPFNLTDRKEMSYCYSTIEGLEGYPTCFTRDDCSILNMECMENEVRLSSGDSTASLLSMQEGCYQKLLTCNKKKNIISQNFDPIIFNGNAQDNYYGWFNEICLTKGFNHKLKTIYAYKIDTQNGKCIIDTAKATPGADCSAGGKMPNCPCTEYVLGSTPAHIQSINSINRIERMETPHEAGLCIDIPLPKTCRAINYLPGINTANPDDKFFITSSINKLVGASYSDSTGVHTSHKFRTEGTSQNPLRGNAEFNSTIVGSSSKGLCNGFWKHKITSGNIIYPELSCILNGAQEAEWNSSITDPNRACERYSCRSITSQGILDLNSDQYQNNYGSHEIGFNKGASDGYAYWDSYLNTTDFATDRTATSCIPGTRKKDSSISINYTIGSYTIPVSLRSTNTNNNASFFGLITGYNSGILPTRICNQRGEWQAPTNSCERIICPPFNPGRSAPGSLSSPERKLWQELWKRSGGAVFSYQTFSESQTDAQYVPNVTYASRSGTGIVKGSGLNSRISGQCQTNLGFYSNGTPPTLNCDQYGNWTGLENGCLSNCSAITASDSNFGIGSGFSEWLESAIPPDMESIVVTGSCNSAIGQYPYPYPPRRNAKGERYRLSSSPNSANNEISDTIPDSPATSLPFRTCSKSIFIDEVRSKWSNPSTTCVSTISGKSNSGCVSGIYDSVNAPDDLMVDERINAGVTKHRVRNPWGTHIDIKIPWARREFDQYQIRYCSSSNNYCQDSVDGMAGTHYSANYYSATKTSNYGLFALVRKCSLSSKKWDPPYPVCIATGSLENNLHATAEAPSSLNGYGDSTTHYTLPNNDNSDNYKIDMTCDTGYEAPETQSLRCQSDNPEVVDMFKLNKVHSDTDRNTCRKFCEFNSTGSPKTDGNSHSSLTSSYTNTSKVYSGDVVTFQCNSSNQCGTTVATGVNGTCGDSGWQIIGFDCHACANCSRTGPTNLDTVNATGSTETDRIYTRTFNNDQVTERFDPLCLFRNAPTLSASYPHNSIVGIYKEKSRDTWVVFANINEGKVCGAVQFTCNDGKWEYSGDYTHGWACDRWGNYSYVSSQNCMIGHHWEDRSRPAQYRVTCVPDANEYRVCDNILYQSSCVENKSDPGYERNDSSLISKACER